ncbi:PREDICTED: uncharacterized protein LOC107355424 [Acropora digitifera]|nr:PREDICTED: uncharacterized protein LOC107355424 [Acropora digitifera]
MASNEEGSTHTRTIQKRAKKTQDQACQFDAALLEEERGTCEACNQISGSANCLSQPHVIQLDPDGHIERTTVIRVVTADDDDYKVTEASPSRYGGRCNGTDNPPTVIVSPGGHLKEEYIMEDDDYARRSQSPPPILFQE